MRGAPGGTRTPDPQLRRLLLYPPELLALRRGVGAPGFEPGTSCSQSRRDTRLRYAPHENPTIVGHSNRVNSRTDSATARPMSQRARTEAALLQALDTPSTLQLPSPLQRGEELRECSSAMTHPLLRSNGRV